MRFRVAKNYSDVLVTMYAKSGQLQKAQALLDMHNSSYIVPWNKDLQRGTLIHNEVQKRDLVDKNYSNVLVNMYAQCSQLPKAQESHNISYIVPWNALITGYARQGKGQQALDYFELMQR